MISPSDYYSITKECIYKGERYSIRDNGAIQRHARIGKRHRKDDDIWTFGIPCSQSGYMKIGNEVVHRIVATAFHGEAPTPQHVIDHIDTNRRNNRPENLRWLTRLENVLNNPITRNRIIYCCGSIEVFIKNPAILKEFVNKDPNFEWMQAVSPDEARNAIENLPQFGIRKW